MPSERVRLVVKQPTIKPYIEEVPAGVKPFDRIREIVAGPFHKEGHVETIRYNDRVTLCVNEDGRALELPMSWMTEEHVFFGRLVFARFTTDSIVDLTDKDIADVLAAFDAGGRSRDDVDDDLDRCFTCHMVLDGTPHDCDGER